MESIIQKERECFLCRHEGMIFEDTFNVLEKHHCLHGTANRKCAEKYGLTVWLCKSHHTGTNGVHGKNGAKVDLYLKGIAQMKFELAYPDLSFREIFGKNYI